MSQEQPTVGYRAKIRAESHARWTLAVFRAKSKWEPGVKGFDRLNSLWRRSSISETTHAIHATIAHPLVIDAGRHHHE